MAPPTAAPPIVAPAPLEPAEPDAAAQPDTSDEPADEGDADWVLIEGSGSELADFEMQRTEVTVEAYRACVDAGACEEPRAIGTRRPSSCNWFEEGLDQHPIDCVTWHDAVAYCEWQDARLPTKTEWRWASSGRGERRKYPWGDEPPAPERLNGAGGERVDPSTQGYGFVLMYDDDGWVDTAPVGSKPAGQSRDGVLDLAGNVREWTTTPPISAGGYQLVGGSYLDSSALWFANDNLSTYSSAADFRAVGHGIRCVRAAISFSGNP